MHVNKVSSMLGIRYARCPGIRYRDIVDHNFKYIETFSHKLNSSPVIISSQMLSLCFRMFGESFGIC